MHLRRLARRADARLASCAGFTIVEVLVASIVLTLGIIFVFSDFSSSQKLGTSAEAHQSAVGVAEHEVERLRGLKWESLGLKEEKYVPVHNAETGNPAYYVVSPASTKCPGNGPTETNCYEWASGLQEPLVLEAGNESAVSDPHSETVNVTTAVASGARFTFSVYRFITWAYDKECTLTACKGKTDAKRIVVSVTGSHLDKPVTVISLDNDRELGSKDALKGLKCEEAGVEVECVLQK